MLGRCYSVAGFFLAILYAWLMLLPWGPPTPNGSLDSSWQIVFQKLPEYHWQCGEDIVFTFGPLGWLFGIANPDNLLPSLAVHAVVVFFLASTIWAITWGIPRRRVSRDLFSGLAVVLLVEACGWSHTMEAKVVLLAWEVMLLAFFRQIGTAMPDVRLASSTAMATKPGFLSFENDRLFVFLESGLIFCLGLLSLCKFPSLLIALATVGGVSMHAVLQHRWPWQLPLWILVVLAAWVVSGQDVFAIVPYLRSSAEISAGYGKAMQDSCAERVVFAYMAAFGGCLLGHYWILRKRPWKAFMVPLITMASVLFLLFKGAFVRADASHLAGIMFALPAVGFLSSCFFRKRLPSGKDQWPLGIAFVLALILIFAFGSLDASRRARVVVRRGEILRSALTFLDGTSKYTHDYEASFEMIGKTFQKVPDDVSVDLYPFEIGRLLAAGKNCQPRPVFQSYSAYTPRLLRMNAEHLKGDRAPDWVLFKIETIDDQYPSLSDGLSWLDLVARYGLNSTQTSSDFGGYLPLVRSEKPSVWKKDLIEERDVAFGQPLNVPDASQGPIWTEVEIRPNTKGTVKGLLLRESMVYVDVESREKSHTYRFVRGMAETGFLLSPLVQNAGDFAWLASTPWQDPAWQRYLRHTQLRSVTFQTRSVSSFCPTIHVRFYRWAFEGWKNARAAFSAEKLALLELMRAAEKNAEASSPNAPSHGVVVNYGEQTGVSFANGKAARWPVAQDNACAPLPTSTKTLRIHYGVLPSGTLVWTPRKKLSCTFQLFAVDQNGEGHYVWSAMLPASLDDPFPCREVTVPVKLEGIRSLAFFMTRDSDADIRQPVWLGLTPN
jgi:hypothetical protein